MSARPTVVVGPAAAVGLEPDPLDGKGAPEAFSRDLAEWGPGTVSGLWRCEPGVFADVESAEAFVVLEGRATIEADGRRYELAPGVVCTLAAGAETVWTVHETLLKFYVLAEG